MADERPPSRGSSLFSDETERFRPISPNVWADLNQEVGEWFEFEPQEPAAEEVEESVEPDSSTDWAMEDAAEDDFSGPADSTSWWNFEDDVSEGPADSTTP